ncbi:glutathione s-transferase domain-containing protein [Nannochloropsis oceanica]
MVNATSVVFLSCITCVMMASSSLAFAAPATTVQSKVRLWNSGTCPYAQRAWLALLEKEVQFEHKIVDLQNKPEDFIALYASLHPDPTARAKAVMRLLGEMWTHSGMGNYFPLLLAGQAGKEGEEARAVELDKMKKGMKIMDTFLRQYGCDVAESPFLLKSGFCLGEVCLAPFVQRLLIVVPHWAGVDLLEMTDKEGWGRLKVWMEAVAWRESTVKSGGTKEETIKNYTRLLAMMKGAGANEATK